MSSGHFTEHRLISDHYLLQPFWSCSIEMLKIERLSYAWNDF